jgi:GNAT superfamily N-acetyltransferase
LLSLPVHMALRGQAVCFARRAPENDPAVNDARCEIRRAGAGDADAVADLAAELAQSFPLSRARFHLTYPALLAADGACLLLAVEEQERLGYLLGFQHLTFYANGPVAWVEEVLVRRQDRGRGIGRALMRAFEQWAAEQGCGLIALATRRAAPFYRALGYEESAVYFRKVLDDVTTD